MVGDEVLFFYYTHGMWSIMVEEWRWRIMVNNGWRWIMVEDEVLLLLLSSLRVINNGWRWSIMAINDK